MKRIYRAKKEKGKFVIVDEDLMRDEIRTLNDGNYELIIRKQKKHRSLQQNAYYWGVVLKILSIETGHTDEEVHQHMKWRFLRKKGGKLETVRSTTDLSTVEMENYLADIRMFSAQDLNIQIPEPNEVDYEQS